MSEMKSQNIDFGANVVTIDNGETKSAVLDTSSNVITGIIAPATFDGSQITLEVSDSASGTFVPLLNSDGTDYTLVVAASQAVIVVPQFVAGWRFLKFVADVTQTGTDTDLLVFGRPI